MSFFNFLISLLFGLVEGITEWLPISSTGHMILFDELFNVESIFGDDFWDLFLVVIQLGAIIAVVILFWKKLWPFQKGIEKEERNNILFTWRNVIIACIPAAIVGLLLDDWLDDTFYNFPTVSITLIIYGILFIVLENFNKKRTFKINDVKQISIKMAFIIGCIQLLALIPGTSRSGVTILGAMLLGCNRKSSAEFSFFLSIPVMFGASLLKGVEFFKDGNTLTVSSSLFLLFGCLSAFIVSIIAIKFLLKYINTHDFKAFGIYRIVLGIILICYFISTL